MHCSQSTQILGSRFFRPPVGPPCEMVRSKNTEPLESADKKVKTTADRRRYEQRAGLVEQRAQQFITCGDECSQRSAVTP